MSHLLSTVNPEAAARIENGPQPPDVGTMVVYIARQGMQRMGRREFPAIVLGADSEGHLELFVLMEPEDMIMESHVRFQDQHQEGHCWRKIERDGDIDGEILGDTILKCEGLQKQIDDLKKLLLGDYKPAKLSVYDLLAEFEGKLKKG